MSGLNKAIVVGYVGKDPETRAAGSQNVCNFSVATSEKYDGQERTEWHRIVAWGKLADACAKYLAKGSLVAVEGKLQTREWEDKNGAKQRTTEIVALSVQFLSKPPQRRQDPDQGESRGFPTSRDDDIAF